MKRMMVGLVVALVAILAAGMPSLGQYSGLKDGIKDKIQGGMSDRNAALNEAMGENPLPGGPPVQTTEGGRALKVGWITKKVNGKDVKYFFAYPEDLAKGANAAGMLMLHERWGVNDQIQGWARLFAARGNYVIAPEMLPWLGESAGAGKIVTNAASDAAVMPIMKVGLDLLQQEATNGVIDKRRVGVFGSDIGARQAILLSVADPRVHATMLFYGPFITDPLKLKNWHSAIFILHGEKDVESTTEDMKKFEGIVWPYFDKIVNRAAFMGSLTVDYVGHGFASTSFGSAYNPVEAQRAIKAMCVFWESKFTSPPWWEEQGDAKKPVAPLPPKRSLFPEKPQ